MYQKTLNWALKYNPEFYETLKKNKEISIQTLNIERESTKPRKDFAMYSEVEAGLWYMYKEKFEPTEYEWQKITEKEEIKTILNTYMNEFFCETDTEEEWFSNVKSCCDKLGYASNMKEYKQNPEKFKGNVADVSTVIRVALTSKSRTPNLYDIIRILGKEEIKRRIEMI